MLVWSKGRRRRRRPKWSLGGRGWDTRQWRKCNPKHALQYLTSTVFVRAGWAGFPLHLTLAHKTYHLYWVELTTRCVRSTKSHVRQPQRKQYVQINRYLTSTWLIPKRKCSVSGNKEKIWRDTIKVYLSVFISCCCLISNITSGKQLLLVLTWDLLRKSQFTTVEVQGFSSFEVIFFLVFKVETLNTRQKMTKTDFCLTVNSKMLRVELQQTWNLVIMRKPF